MTERGPKGDHGQHGETGEQGRQGEPGLVSQGERGPTGDRGQAGDTGRVGRTGATGQAGADPTRKLAILFAFLAITAVTYGVVLQQAIERINENAARVEQERILDAYEECVGGATLIGLFNQQQTALADVDRAALVNTDPPPTEFAMSILVERIKAYESGVLPLPDCEAIRP